VHLGPIGKDTIAADCEKVHVLQPGPRAASVRSFTDGTYGP
jgi:hypothetical protein